jgi:hypothetical protein
VLEQRGQPLVRIATFAVALGGHVLLFLLFTSTRGAEQRRNAEAEATILIPLRELARSEPASEDRSAFSPALTSIPNLPSLTPPPNISPSTDAPSVDWAEEREAFAKSLAPGLLDSHERTCAEAERRRQAPPEGCPRRSYDKKWEPEPKRAGFEGLLPYVRIGKRCVVGLGFWGCAMGKLPEADGSLLEDMDDPNLPASSVPDDPDPAFAQRPAPQAFPNAR